MVIGKFIEWGEEGREGVGYEKFVGVTERMKETVMIRKLEIDG